MKITEYTNTGISRRFCSGALRKVAGRPGFTIVELMIVIVVIAILAAISVVAYGNIQQRAHRSAGQAKLRQLTTRITEERLFSGDLPLWVGDTEGRQWWIATLREIFGDRWSGHEGGGYRFVLCRSSDSGHIATALLMRGEPYGGPASVGETGLVYVSGTHTGSINELTFEWLSGRTLVYSICAAAIGEENIVQTAWINTLISG